MDLSRVNILLSGLAAVSGGVSLVLQILGVLRNRRSLKQGLPVGGAGRVTPVPGLGAMGGAREPAPAPPPPPPPPAEAALVEVSPVAELLQETRGSLDGMAGALAEGMASDGLVPWAPALEALAGRCARTVPPLRATHPDAAGVVEDVGRIAGALRDQAALDLRNRDERAWAAAQVKELATELSLLAMEPAAAPPAGAAPNAAGGEDGVRAYYLRFRRDVWLAAAAARGAGAGA